MPYPFDKPEPIKDPCPYKFGAIVNDCKNCDCTHKTKDNDKNIHPTTDS